MNEMKLFDDISIRTIWNEEEQQWYFSVVDVVAVLSGSTQPRKYWNDLKKKLSIMGSQLSEKIGQLKMKSSDGKYYNTDALNTDGILRLVQSIPSKKAEPFKIWLATVGRERLEEIADPAKAIERARETYRQKGYPEEWIVARIESIEARNELTDEWKNRGVVDNKEYAILTAEISKAAFGMTPTEYKEHKSIDKPLVNLRDHMSPLELIFTRLSEQTTKDLARLEDAQGMKENTCVAKKGGVATGAALKAYEKDLGIKVVTRSNYVHLNTTNKEEINNNKK